jgi:carboxypeptidase Taq
VTTVREVLEQLRKLDREIQLLEHVAALLEWDQETYMPERAIEERADQIALLKGLLHTRITSPKVGELLGKLGVTEEKPQGSYAESDTDQAFVREVFRRFSKNTKLPKEFVELLARQQALTQADWVKAREASDFSLFTPRFKDLLKLIIQKAEYLGFVENRYDPLLDEHEPWMKTSQVQKIFTKLRPLLKETLQNILSSRREIDTSFLRRDYEIARQRELVLSVLKAMGYTFENSRLDTSAHPFSTTVGRFDIRLTTRYVKDLFGAGLFGAIHEGGHGLYEMGFSEELEGSLLASGTSLGIHESQSRMWENIIGRSLSFWKFFYPELKRFFPHNFEGISLDDFYRAINRVQPSLIRIESDEVTYNLHIILRFNLELKLIAGDLSVQDVPAAWRDESKGLLNVIPERDAEGALQDIHWSIGAIGYFPTYSLGNLYAAQFFAKMKKDIPSLEREIEAGKLSVVLEWLRQNIHRHGSVYPADELCKKVTGESLNPVYFSTYLHEKFRSIYGI